MHPSNFWLLFCLHILCIMWYVLDLWCLPSPERLNCLLQRTSVRQKYCSYINRNNQITAQSNSCACCPPFIVHWLWNYNECEFFSDGIFDMGGKASSAICSSANAEGASWTVQRQSSAWKWGYCSAARSTDTCSAHRGLRIKMNLPSVTLYQVISKTCMEPLKFCFLSLPQH